MEPAIVIDVDGVLHLQPPGVFNETSVGALEECVRGTGAAIILSSAWRASTSRRAEVNMALRRHGLPELSGYTPEHSGGRAAEILAWAAESGCTCWVAIDDSALGDDEQLQHHFVQVDGNVGLQPADAELVIEHLRVFAQQAIGVPSVPRRRRARVRVPEGLAAELSGSVVCEL